MSLIAREALSQFVEKIEISPTKEARLYARAFVLWLCMERVNIPTKPCALPHGR